MLELVEGPTLADRICQGADPTRWAEPLLDDEVGINLKRVSRALHV